MRELINHTRDEEYLFGGDILEISKFLKRCQSTKFFFSDIFFSLGEKFAGEEVENEDVRVDFTGNMYSVLNTLVLSKVGWEDISQNISKYLKQI